MNRKKYEIYESKEYNNIREVLDNAFTNYPDNVAFKLKETNGKQVTYKEIKYKNFQNDINALGTALINLGLKDKRVAIISKNRYEWILSYVSILNGTGIAVPLDKGLPEEETESSLHRSYAEAVIFANDYMDTLQMARRELPNLEHHRLTDLAEYYGISAEGAHRALNDCRMNQQVFESPIR